jgi:hypothetical protein
MVKVFTMGLLKKEGNRVIAISSRRFEGRNEEAISSGKACIFGRLPA